jgi:isorenieratene synthase
MSESSNSPALPPISRRTALKLLGVGAVGGVVGYSRFSKPQPTLFQQDTLDLPQRLNQKKALLWLGLDSLD